ncbi:MAG: YibE/F family protein [Clostridia bacterium]|nr:YibE/F family protein [Clostridia bacterium]MDD4047818.1 YibE/F family protein [Clostridia bacterium]
MQKKLAYVISLLLIIGGFAYSKSLNYEGQVNSEIMVKGIVEEVTELELSQEQAESMFVENGYLVRVKIKDGSFAGRLVNTKHYEDSNPAYSFKVYPGDEVVLNLEVEDYILKEAYIAGIARDKYLTYLLIAFLLCILIIGAKQGIKTILSLFITGWAVIKILLPAILLGKDPVIITILICAGVTIITHMIITGFTKKSLAAISGTVLGILVGGILAKTVISLSRLSGLTTEESRILFFNLPQGQLDPTGILFAGIVVGSLGAVMDVAMTIASSMTEIYKSNPSLTLKELTKSGLNIGRDIIGTMSNTLILAYVGSALPLLLLFTAYNIPLIKYVNLDIITAEIIRALSGSIGLFLAVPFTAFISALLCRMKHAKVD